jgi:hypothetical protein
VDQGRCRAGEVEIVFEEPPGKEGGPGKKGILGWTVAGLGQAEPANSADRPTSLDTLPTHRGAKNSTSRSEIHPTGEGEGLGVVRIDHLVVFTGELERTIAAFEGAGLAVRRVREPGEPGPPVRQAFFRLGEVIVEVVENPVAPGEGASFWGITFCVADLDRCAGLLGEQLGGIHEAVQPGRRIATMRRSAGLGVPVALITPESAE